MNSLVTADYLVFTFYFLLVTSYGIWIYKRKKKAVVDTKDFFLAEGSLTWWAIGASLIASNISAEQFIGMSGAGFSMGIAIAAYEWMAAIALIIIAIWFMPIYLKNKIFTMPQFLKQRYNESVSLIMAIFWLFLYVFVNLTSILFLGALAINNLTGGAHFHLIMILLACFALFITLGGMKVIGYTDVIQVVVLIIGGLVTSYIALVLVSEHFGMGKNMLAGFNKLMEDAPEHFKMIFDKPGENATQAEVNNYLALPGIAMYAAGQWIANLNYWGCNQYITQRALGADLKTARTGILFAGFLKIMMPVIVMLPGIAAFVLHKNGGLQAQMLANGKVSADNAYPAILAYLPNGLKGLSIAALTAAIVASLAGKVNSISTIFTLDIYKKYINKQATETNMVWRGRIVIGIAMAIAIAFTWNDLLGISSEGGFIFIQKYTGLISPGVFAMFILGFFWKRTTGPAAIAGLLSGFLCSLFFMNYAPGVFGNQTWLYTAFRNSGGVYEIPFLLNMGYSFFFAIAVMVGISLLSPAVNPKGLEIDRSMFKIKPLHTVLIIIILLLITLIYVKFW
ncbi:SLC5/6 family protein [Ferruginibacter profundus]